MNLDTWKSANFKVWGTFIIKLHMEKEETQGRWMIRKLVWRQENCFSRN